MLAYVLNGDVPGALDGIEGMIRNLHPDLGMDPPGGFQLSRIRPADPRARETLHRRKHDTVPFVIHHLFMAGDPNAPMLPEPPADSAGAGSKKRRSTPERKSRK